MNLSKQIKPNRRVFQYFRGWSRNGHIRSFSASSKQEVKKSGDQIIIPKAIKRGPTDILKALSSTVGKDYTAPHYRYMDDPFLTPASHTDKRTFSLSKESGRRAALYFFEKYPEHFYRDLSEPKIDAFTYRDVYDAGMNFEPVDLERAIACEQVCNAMIAYEGLLAAEMEISSQTLYDLLDLVCFHNCSDPSDKFLDENHFKAVTRAVPNTWKDNGFAERLFETIKPKTSRGYSAIISGMTRHGQFERAFAFYHQVIELGLPLNATGYNSLIEASFGQHSNNDDRWKVITDLLSTMEVHRIRPNLGTLNAILNQIARYRFWALNHDAARKTLNEFAYKHNIQPSLATFYHLLYIFGRSRANQSNIVHEIMDIVEKQDSLLLQDLDDFRFLSQAMEVAYSLNDPKLGQRIDRLASLHPKFLGNSLNSNNFYHRYLKLLCTCESIEKFMEIYERYVPNIHTPNIELTEQIISVIKIYKAHEYVERMWNDILLSGYSNRMEMVELLLSTMKAIIPDDNPAVVAKFADIVANVLEKVNTRMAKYEQDGVITDFKWSNGALSSALFILDKANQEQLAAEVKKLIEED